MFTNLLLDSLRGLLPLSKASFACCFFLPSTTRRPCRASRAMPFRFILFAILSSLFFSSSFAHYPGPNNHHHEHYARQLATPTYEPLHRRSATPTSGHHSATPTLARRSATPVLSRRDGLQRRYDFESYLKRRQAPSPLPSGMLNRRQAPSPLPSGMLNRRQAPSPMPSATWKRSAEEQSNWDMMYELSRERRSYGETVDEGYYSETNARRIKRGGNRESPSVFDPRGRHRD